MACILFWVPPLQCLKWSKRKTWQLIGQKFWDILDLTTWWLWARNFVKQQCTASSSRCAGINQRKVRIELGDIWSSSLSHIISESTVHQPSLGQSIPEVVLGPGSLQILIWQPIKGIKTWLFQTFRENGGKRSLPSTDRFPSDISLHYLYGKPFNKTTHLVAVSDYLLYCISNPLIAQYSSN